MQTWLLLDCLPACSVAPLCPALCDPMGCSPPSSSAHGILQARTLEWVAISSFRASFWPRDQTLVSWVCIGRRILYHGATWEAPCFFIKSLKKFTFFLGSYPNARRWTFKNLLHFALNLSFQIPCFHSSLLLKPHKWQICMPLISLPGNSFFCELFWQSPLILQFSVTLDSKSPKG